MISYSPMWNFKDKLCWKPYHWVVSGINWSSSRTAVQGTVRFGYISWIKQQTFKHQTLLQIKSILGCLSSFGLLLQYFLCNCMMGNINLNLDLVVAEELVEKLNRSKACSTEMEPELSNHVFSSEKGWKFGSQNHQRIYIAKAKFISCTEAA